MREKSLLSKLQFHDSCSSWLYNFWVIIGDVFMALFSLQNDDDWFDSAPTDGADVSLSHIATALYMTPFDTFNNTPDQLITWHPNPTEAKSL